MALPPPWYVLLLATTLAVAPFILKGAAGPSARRFALRVLLGLVVLELGLVLLFYSRWLCWPLIVVSVGLLASLADARHPTRAAGLLVP